MDGYDQIKNYLDKKDISYTGSDSDFHFILHGRRYIIELDEDHHFDFIQSVFESEDEFDEFQYGDIRSTILAIQAGYYMIRIAKYDTINIDNFLDSILDNPNDHPKLIVSDEGLYGWLLSGVLMKLI